LSFSIQEFKTRRDKLLANMGEGVAIVPTAAEVARNRDSHFPYRFDSYFYYLTGFKEPESVLVLIAGDQPKSILFCRDKDMEREIWDGFRYGPKAAQDTFGFDEAYPFNQLDEMMPRLLSNQPKLFYSLGADAAWDVKVTNWLNQVKDLARTGVSAPEAMLDVRQLVDRQRLIKTPFEIDLMRRSANIAATAHNRAMQKTQVGKMEYEIEAECLHEFYRKGAQSPAYTSIVAGGANACTLHYNANNGVLNDGELLLIDAGCELDGYASDITRTFPVSGQFSGPQKDLYELVLAAQLAAIDAAKPNNHWNKPHEVALEVLVQGFVDVGLCQGTKDEVLEKGDYRQFYMHRTGHWLGLDVHDVGDYKDKQGNWTALAAGHVLTVEPGCYVRPAENVPEHFWNIGIRIEDDVLITAQGNEVLSKDAIKSIADIEAQMAGRR
jgi:Xaa-Pro aminopeptidase